MTKTEVKRKLEGRKEAILNQIHESHEKMKEFDSKGWGDLAHNRQKEIDNLWERWFEVNEVIRLF